jgi:translin
MSLKSLLVKIQEELRTKDQLREESQRDMRRATRLSKQAILFTHEEKLEEAENLLLEASKLFVKLRKITFNHLDLVYTGTVDAALQEYAEANIFLRLVKNCIFVKPEEIGIPSIPYVLGLADVIGEFRRRALDLLRRRDIEAAENCLKTMEQIHIDLVAMDDAYLLVPGLRRKDDIARRIIEATRGDITLETRRSSLEISIRALKNKLESAH